MTQLTKRFSSVFVLLSAVFLLGGITAQSSAASQPRINNPILTAYASCANKKPFKPAKKCNYDGSTKFRGTFFFKSKIGAVDAKTCFRIYGPKPLGGRHDCGEIPSVTSRALPFTTTGVRQKYKVVFTLFTKGVDSEFGYGKVATVGLKVRP